MWRVYYGGTAVNGGWVTFWYPWAFCVLWGLQFDHWGRRHGVQEILAKDVDEVILEDHRSRYGLGGLS
jgi:hypothetical protein